MRKNFYAIALAAICLGFTWFEANAQVNIFWEEVGPNNMGNHVRGLTVDGSGNVWAGSTGGGLWKSTNNGSTWEQVSGVDENLMVSSIAVDGNNIYVGTGETYFYEPSSSFITSWTHDSVSTIEEGYPMLFGSPGEGVFASTDGGSTWDHDNGTWSGSSTRYQNNFISIQKVATSGGRTMIATLEGLYFSTSATLTSVTKASGTDHFENSPIVDVEFAAGGIVLAATADSLYRSTNNGTSCGKAIN
ncbi:MAG: hypothetical protein AAF570_06530, partial [Bacteroidota bacterium]